MTNNAKAIDKKNLPFIHINLLLYAYTTKGYGEKKARHIQTTYDANIKDIRVLTYHCHTRKKNNNIKIIVLQIRIANK